LKCSQSSPCSTLPRVRFILPFILPGNHLKTGLIRMIKWRETRSLKHPTLRIISAHKLSTDACTMNRTDYILQRYVQVLYSSKQSKSQQPNKRAPTQTANTQPFPYYMSPNLLLTLAICQSVHRHGAVRIT
jgi:hypothetical protein